MKTRRDWDGIGRDWVGLLGPVPAERGFRERLLLDGQHRCRGMGAGLGGIVRDWAGGAGFGEIAAGLERDDL